MYAQLKQLYPNADFTTDIILQDDGDGVYIKHFDAEKLGAQPTQAVIDAVVIAAKTQVQLDYDRYIKRAQAKDKILAEFASENMSRIRAGTWTVPNLIELTQDAQLNLLLANINTLSYELAINSVQSITNPLITPEIKAGWIAKLQSHLYLIP